MSPYPSVAVIMAEPDAEAPDLTPEPRQPAELAEATVVLGSELAQDEQVRIAPDASLRYIVLAPTKAAGEEEAAALGITPVAILTPRSPDGARGVPADQVIVVEGLTPAQYDGLLPHALPSLETAQS